ncbi:MAG: rRNA pseudouridine synthase [Candidatus Omnitrophica bacterium]|nr:rRNA pseudouridine synthase [Candidatus Omnitrophota bacterium]
MRLSLFIAKSGFASRRGADLLIQQGKVSVNGKVVKEPFFRVAESDKVLVNGKVVDRKDKIYIIFNKPKGVTTTRKDKFADKTVIDFLENKFKSLYPVGRLDKNSTGLLILTNDGDLCFELTHPKFVTEKEYVLTVRGRFTTNDCAKAIAGVTNEGDLLRVKRIKIIKQTEYESKCSVVVAEGKKRHLRRLFRGLNFGVKSLKRVRIGKLLLGVLGPGEYIVVDRAKILKALG